MYISPQWSSETSGQEGVVSVGAPGGPRLPRTELLFCATLLWSGEFIYISFYQPSTGPGLVETAISCNRGQVCRRGGRDESTAKRKIMAHPFFNEKTDGEQSIKRMRQLSDRWTSQNRSVSTGKKNHTKIILKLNRSRECHAEIYDNWKRKQLKAWKAWWDYK